MPLFAELDARDCRFPNRPVVFQQADLEIGVTFRDLHDSENTVLLRIMELQLIVQTAQDFLVVFYRSPILRQ